MWLLLSSWVGATEPDLLAVQQTCDSLVEDADHYAMDELKERMEGLRTQLRPELVSCLAEARQMEMARHAADLLSVREALEGWLPGQPLVLELRSIEGDDRVHGYHAAGLFVVALGHLTSIDRGMASYAIQSPDLREFGEEFTGRATAALDAPAASSPEMLGTRAEGLLEDPERRAGLVGALLVLEFQGSESHPQVAWELRSLASWTGDTGRMVFERSPEPIGGSWERVEPPPLPSPGPQRLLLWTGVGVTGVGLATVGTTAAINVTNTTGYTQSEWRALAATQVGGWVGTAAGAGLVGLHIWRERRQGREE